MSSKHHTNNKIRTQDKISFEADTITRRAFLKRTLTIGTVGLVAPSLLAACGGGQQSDTGSQSRDTSGQPAASTCEGSGTDAVTRNALNYVDESPHEGKTCANCRFFKLPSGDDACGGCEIVSGPIAPAGYCTAWAIRDS